MTHYPVFVAIFAGSLLLTAISKNFFARYMQYSDAVIIQKKIPQTWNVATQFGSMKRAPDCSCNERCSPRIRFDWICRLIREFVVTSHVKFPFLSLVDRQFANQVVSHQEHRKNHWICRLLLFYKSVSNGNFHIIQINIANSRLN